MSILDDIDAEVASAQRRACKTCEWLDQQPSDERTQWYEAIADMTRDTNPIFRAMQKHGFTGSSSSFREHRKNHSQEES